MRFLLIALFVGACGEPRFSSASGELVLQPAALTFDRVFVGYPQSAELVLSNQGRTALPVSVNVEGPIELREPPETLPGASSVKLMVVIAPTAAGAAEGTVTIGVEGRMFAVPVTVIVESPPVCGDTECHAGVFDPVAGTCMQVSQADGTACSSPCLREARCVAGRCVGTTKSCDDGNVCTADSCDPARGCVHEETTAACGLPANPCAVATCDPATGCGEVAAPDYTPCGPVTCASANVCLGGKCTALEPPEGFPCSSATACKSAGRCHSKVCVESQPTPLAVEWTYTAARHLESDPPMADADGNLYWLESFSRASSSCEQFYARGTPEIAECERDLAVRNWLRSSTADGRLRFRIPIPSSTSASPLLVNRTRIVLVSSQFLHIRSSEDGRLLYARSLGKALADPWQLSGAAYARWIDDTRIAVVRDYTGGPTGHAKTLEVFDRDGRFLWERGRAAPSDTSNDWTAQDLKLVAGYGRVAVWTRDAVLRVYDVSGPFHGRWPLEFFFPTFSPRAFAGPDLIVSEEGLDPQAGQFTAFRVSEGRMVWAVRANRPTDAFAGIDPLFFVGSEGTLSGQRGSVRAVDPRTGATRWASQPQAMLRHAHVTASGNLLATQRADGETRTMLLELDGKTGAEVQRCEVPASDISLFIPERWVTYSWMKNRFQVHQAPGLFPRR